MIGQIRLLLHLLRFHCRCHRNRLLAVNGCSWRIHRSPRRSHHCQRRYRCCPEGLERGLPCSMDSSRQDSCQTYYPSASPKFKPDLMDFCCDKDFVLSSCSHQGLERCHHSYYFHIFGSFERIPLVPRLASMRSRLHQHTFSVLAGRLVPISG